jgi:hypothetical protein
MSTSLLIVFGIAGGIVAVFLLRDVFLIVWKQGYDQGRKAEAECWTKLAAEADEAVKEMGRKNS